MVLTGILMGILFGPMDSLYTSNARGLKRIAVTADAHSALNAMQNTIQLSTGFLSANSVSDPAGTTWHATNSGVNNVLITSNYATTIDESADSAGNRKLALASDCSTPLQNNYVFFVSNGKLYRRTLTNKSSACSGYANNQKQTCAPGSTVSGCQGADALLTTGVTSFTISYYASPEATATVSNPVSASTVVLHVTLQNGSGTQAVTSSNNLRVTQIN